MLAASVRVEAVVPQVPIVARSVGVAAVRPPLVARAVGDVTRWSPLPGVVPSADRQSAVAVGRVVR